MQNAWKAPRRVRISFLKGIAAIPSSSGCARDGEKFRKDRELIQRYLVAVFLTTVLAVVSPAATAGTVTLEWDASPSAGVSGYNVHYGTTGGGPYPNIEDAGNQLTHTVTGLTNGQMYFFVVTAYRHRPGRVDESEPSGEVSAGVTTLTATPTTSDFGSVIVGATSPSQPIQLTHRGASGDVPIWVQSASLFSSQFIDDFTDDDFTDDGDPVTLAPGQSTTINVTFAPTSEGNKFDVLQITHGGANPRLDILLTGTGAVDSDSDGMSDNFENQFGLNPNDSNDAGLDPDGDGISNLDEFLNNTDPTVHKDAPAVINIINSILLGD